MNRQAAATILGLDLSATPEEVRRAFQRLSYAHHPDRHPHAREEATERIKELSKARDVMTAPPKPEPVPAAVIVELFLSGPITWRGGELEVNLRDGRMGVVSVPPAVEMHAMLPIQVPAGGPAYGAVLGLDSAPWRRGPDANLGALDLGARLEVSLYDVVCGSRVEIPTPWSRRVEIKLQPSQFSPIRLRGQGLRPAGAEPGSLVLELKVLPVPADDRWIQNALQGYRSPARLR